MYRQALPAFLVLTLAGCALQHQLTPASAEDRSICPTMSLEFLGSGSISAETLLDGARVGGLSGIDFDKTKRRFVLITDDRGANGGTRVFTADIASQRDKSVALDLKSALPLRMMRRVHAGSDISTAGVDGEAIRTLPDGQFVWASEGDDAMKMPAGVYLSGRDGTTARPLHLPVQLLTDDGGSKGPRPNRSFEGLALAPDAKSVFIAIEAPLLGMGEVPTLTHGADAPIYQLDFNGRIKEQFDYPLDPIARQVDGLLADNGISEILALDARRFLVLERSGSQQPDGSFRFVTRLFCAWSTAQAKPMRLQKQLVAEFNRLGPFENANFEGMTFGPELPDGRRVLVFVADNDFRSDRSTLVAKFAVNDQRKRD